MGNASQSSSGATRYASVSLVGVLVTSAVRVTCLAPSRVAPASSHAVATKHVPLSRSVTHVNDAPPRGSGEGAGEVNDEGRGAIRGGGPVEGPLIPDATAEA